MQVLGVDTIAHSLLYIHTEGMTLLRHYTTSNFPPVTRNEEAAYIVIPEHSSEHTERIRIVNVERLRGVTYID
jgi:CTP-dependent riboflavin kinase